MDCAKSLELLSDFRDGALGKEDKVFVKGHLADCPPCAGVFQDLDLIVVAASSLRRDDGLTFPDEDAIWQRMSLGARTVH